MSKEALWLLLGAAVVLAAWQAALVAKQRRQMVTVVRGAQRAIENAHDDP